jgi:hypothetical protein
MKSSGGAIGSNESSLGCVRRRLRRAPVGVGAWVVAGRSCQQPRCSRPVSGRRFGSRAHQPRSLVRDAWKWRHVEQVVDERWQTQHAPTLPVVLRNAGSATS